MRRNRGFTLIEVIVVAAIIAILAGILVPLIFNQIDEAKKTRALGECKSIANSVILFRKDTGKWPLFFPDDCANTYLTLASDGSDPKNAAGDWKISVNENTLAAMLNLPVTDPLIACYNNKTDLNYMPQTTPDPWGNKYIVNVVNFANSNPVWVISAGPNGVIDTTVNSPALNDAVTTGDDIGIRIK
jgi:general secretion pathway protein G